MITYSSVSILSPYLFIINYSAHRADRIELQIWTEGGTLSMDQRSKMSNEEIDYATGYANLIATYQDAEDTDLRMVS